MSLLGLVGISALIKIKNQKYNQKYNSILKCRFRAILVPSDLVELSDHKALRYVSKMSVVQ